MKNPKILAFAGSLRKESWNQKLIRAAAEGARKAGCEVTLLDLAEYPLPLMDEDLEAREGLPANAKKLKEIFLDHQGLLIAAPEYNSSITPLLKTRSTGCRVRWRVSPGWRVTRAKWLLCSAPPRERSAV